MQSTPLERSAGTRRSITRRVVRRTLRKEFLGFEDYVWLAQRLSGFILIIFLFFHLWTLSAIFGGKEHFDQTMLAFNTPLIKAGELLLLWIILFHGLNGLRLIWITFFPEKDHTILAYAVSLASLLLCLLSIPVFF